MQMKDFDEVEKLRKRWKTVCDALLVFRCGRNERMELRIHVNTYNWRECPCTDTLQIELDSRLARELVLRERDAVAGRLRELGVEVEAVE